MSGARDSAEIARQKKEIKDALNAAAKEAPPIEAPGGTVENYLGVREGEKFAPKRVDSG